MFWPIWTFWTAALPKVPLVLPHANLMMAVVVAVMVLCTVALWFERDRNSAPMPKPFSHEDEHLRLAA